MEQRDRQGSTAPGHAPIPDDERYRRIVEHMPVGIFMHERSALIGALDIRSSTGAGTTVTLVVPATPIGELHPRAEDPT